MTTPGSTPDISQYVDLRIFDKDPTDILRTAIVELQSRMPEWTPREDNTEVMLLESMAVEVAEAVYAINRLPDSIMTALMRLYGIDRDAGAFASTTIEFQVVNSMGYTIPARTRLFLPPTQGYGAMVFETNADLSIPYGYTSGTVPATATEVNDIANGCPPGTRFEVLDQLNFVSDVVNTEQVLGGRAPESDKDWFNRGVQRFGRLTDTLVVPKHFELAALEDPRVRRARALDNYDPSIPDGSPGDHPGHLTLALYGDSGIMTAEEKQSVIDSFATRKFAPLILHTVDPVITTVNVTIRVKANQGYTNERVVDAVSTKLRDWLDTDVWPWKGTVYYNEIIGLVSELPEVDYVTQLVSPAASFPLNGAAPLADLGTVSVQIATDPDA
ncbi:baseplate J protein [Gordonia phage ChisanaKitsune]|uniref:Baseplate J protein n=1 Tax=Gordonia phage ChisanaKitsune TaxID=2871538 RepID=A0AAE7XF22_9CAUD|nr:baseplate wedge subunit [Gordonia phage ChisanaKitsune]QZE10821.1 baseplate J protein [Gordonia phage ChisanaKitsune]